MSIAILSPAPCLPALLHAAETDFELIVERGQSADSDVSAWAMHLQLRDVTNGARINLEVRSVQAVAATQVPATARGAAALAGNTALGRIHLAAAQPLTPTPPRRARVFDLVHGDDVVRARAVVGRRGGGGVLRIAFATDLHVASLWNDIDDALERYAPALRGSLLHPMRLLERMVTELDDLATRGELDVLVLGGDLVDYVYRDRRVSDDVAATNLPLLLERLARLAVPVYAIPGNHDYRLFPWRPRVYPFSGAGLPQAEAARVMRRAGLWDVWPLHRHDLDSLRTSATDSPTLRHHLRAVAPATDFSVELDGLRLIFMATGRDVLPRWKTVERGRLGMLVRSIPVSYHHPDCEGLSEQQIAELCSTLAQCRSAALFFHAPLLNPPPGRTVHAQLDRLEPGADERLPARIRFERHLFGTGMRHGVFFRNPALFVRALRSFNGSLAAFSGHVHGTHAFELDPHSGATRSLPPEEVRANGVHVLLNAPALGQTATSDGEPPGYLLAQFNGGRLTSLQRRALHPS